MIDPLRIAATRWPDAPAVADASTALTWSAVLREAERLAASLRVAPGTRVALLAHERARTVVAIHAIRLAGGVLMPLNRRLAVPELLGQLASSEVLVVAHDAAHSGVISEVVRASTASIRSFDIERTDADRAPGVADDLDPEAAGAVVHTSGTTGLPRGVVLSTRALMASAGAWNTFLDARPTDHWLSTLPMSHVAGLGMALRPLLSGARLTLHERFDPDAVRLSLAQDGITHLSLVPTQLGRLLDAGPADGCSLRALLLGGGPVPAALVRRALDAGLPVVPTYGLTEAGSGVTALPTAEVADAPGSSGRPLPGMRVRVVDPQGADVPADVEGRIIVHGPTLASGYDGDRVGTKEAFIEGWLWTRDLGRLDEHGRLWVTDRMDDLIISGGENVSPAEVEGVLAAHPAVGEVAVFGRPDATWGSVPVAAVTARAGQPAPSLEELRSFARPHLAGYKLPADIRVVAEIPRTSSGKIVRRELAALVAAQALRDIVIPRPDGACIHVESRGQGPLVLLLHATLSNAGELRPLADLLATRFRVLSVDRRSAGASRMPPGDPGGPVDVAVHVADIGAVLDEVAPGELALVVGHSFGGCVALELAARAPERVAGVWVFEPPYLTLLPASAIPDLASLGDRIAALEQAEGPVAAALAFLDAVRGRGTADRLPAAARERLGAEGRSAVADAALQGLDPDGLARIDAPVVVARGGRDAGPYEAVAEALATRVRDLTIERFPELGHGAPVSRPEGLASSITSFAQPIGHLSS